MGVLYGPAVITHRAPGAGVVDFHSALAPARPVRQPQAQTLADIPNNDLCQGSSREAARRETQDVLETVLLIITSLRPFISFHFISFLALGIIYSVC